MGEKQNLSGYLESVFDNNSKDTDEQKKEEKEEVKKTGTEEESDLERIIGKLLR